MQRNVLISLGLTLLLILAVGGLTWRWIQLDAGQSQAEITSTQLDHQIKTIRIGETTLNVEIVNQPASITQGLSGRDEIGADGMLFVLGTDQVAHFWMKDMKFDLDLVWLRDGQVIGVTPQVPKPAPGTPDQNLPVYSPDKPVDLVLEVPAGRAAEWNIYPGAAFQVL